MSDLAQHLIISIQKDAQALSFHGGLTKHNLFLIGSILRDPARDYNIGNNAPPAYTTSKHISDAPMSDKPFLPPRPAEAPRQLPPRPRAVESPPQFHKEPQKQIKPPIPVAAKPISSDKLSSQYRSDQEKKNSNQFQFPTQNASNHNASNQNGTNNASNQNAYAGKLGDKVATGAASGLGWGVGMGVARSLI